MIDYEIESYKLLTEIMKVPHFDLTNAKLIEDALKKAYESGRSSIS